MNGNLIKRGFLFVLLCLFSVSMWAKDYSVMSPDGKINVMISVNKEIKWSAQVSGNSVFKDNTISLSLMTNILGENPRVISAKRNSVDEFVSSVVPVKSKEILNRYNQLHLKFRGEYSVSFRVFDNGIAYRFETAKKGEITIKEEAVNLNFAGDYGVLFPEEKSIYSHYEREYLDKKLSEVGSGNFCSLPVLIKADNNIKIGITEADLYDYPGLFMESAGKNSFSSKFSPVILKWEAKNDRDIKAVKTADYIAVTNGTRTFPWRVFMISEKDTELVENQMVYLLSKGLRLQDTSWIKPGLVSWDWWNDNNLYDVDFKSGINTQTYKYYIDFASKYDVPYIILDEGWSKTTTNVMESNADIDIPALVAYGKKKNVGLILWSLWGPVDKNMNNLFDLYQKWGIKGVKIDFMQHCDQYMVNFYERTVKAAAARHLLVDFHGAYKPSGLRRAYPNMINYEGVKGLENCKGSSSITPEHDVTLPFTRMLAGPLDYTPGAMKNANKANFHPSYSNPMSMGTRCHQMALYVVFDAPLQMMADSPSNYYHEKECTKFISKMKTVWDETKILDAKVADYIVTARRSGQTWFIGSITDFTPRNLSVDLSFLGEGNYEMEYMQDGINANKAAVDFSHGSKKVTRNSKITLPLASGGGWVAILRKL